MCPQKDTLEKRVMRRVAAEKQGQWLSRRKYSIFALSVVGSRWIVLGRNQT